MLATARIPLESIPTGNFMDSHSIFGMEFSGCSAHGHRIMGICASQALATTIITDRRFYWAVPANWTLKDAATVPVAYATAYYALIVRGQLKKKESILIHCGAGGVGMAAISIALAYQCEVFITVGSQEKQDFLLRTFPELKISNFASSRSTNFEIEIMKLTGENGVNLILNSLSEDKLQASVRCLGYGGRFLEIGKFDMANNSALGMSCFLKNITFHGILLDSLFHSREVGKKLHRLMEMGIKSGVVRPLSHIIFDAKEVLYP